jgi:hypothetical protein
MIGYRISGIAAAASLSLALFGGAAAADSIDPTSFSADLDVGESVTLRKTVVVDKGGPTAATIDAYFLIDTSGSMGGVINQAKLAASNIFTSIKSTFGSDVAGGVGVYSENAGLPGDACTVTLSPAVTCSSPGAILSAPATVLNQNITTNQTAITDAIGDVTLNDPDYGGDGPENVVDALKLVADNASWRPGSSRFIFTFSDANGKGLEYTSAEAIAALNAEDITVVALSFTQTIISFVAVSFQLRDGRARSGRCPTAAGSGRRCRRRCRGRCGPCWRSRRPRPCPSVP